MSKQYPNILTKSQCDAVASAMMDLDNQSKLIPENDHYYHNSSGFYNLQATLDLLPFVDEKILPDYSNIKFENTYTRIYRNGSTLTFHTDRKELFLTLSVCIFSNITTDWPLCVSSRPYKGDVWDTSQSFAPYSKEYTQYITPVGSGVTCYGAIFPHWREPLVCKEDQMVIQTFYHWNSI